VFILIPALILYAFEDKLAETENRMKALLTAYAFLIPINLVLDKYEDF
jgi:hypothetical protein